MQRKLLMWNMELKKGEIKSNALKDRERYACVDGEPPDDDDSDKEEEEQKGDPCTRGWVPAPKDDLRLDQMDTFLVGDLDFYQLAAGDPMGLFFKLRYGCRAAEMKNYDKAIQVVEKAQGLAQEALNELEKEYAAKLAADEKERENQPKPSSPKSQSKSTNPSSPKSPKGKDQQALLDPNAELRDVLLMCKTKLRIWNQLHHK